MSLPIRTTIEDITDLCRYLAGKPTGSTVKEAKTVLDSKRLDGRKLTALKFWDLIDETEEGRYKATDAARKLIKSPENQTAVLLDVIRKVSPYNAIIERAAHQREDSVNTTEVASLWHEHFKDQVGDTDRILRDQAVCFFHVAGGAGLGNLVTGRRGAPTRFSFTTQALKSFMGAQATIKNDPEPKREEGGPPKNMGVIDINSNPSNILTQHEEEGFREPDLGKGIFIAHGKNRKPLKQLKGILDQFKIPYRVAVDEPNLGRPISGKVREVMQSCNCAVLIFTADEEFKDKEGNTIWRPSENVVFELGATGYLYDNKIVILKEEGVSFPTNFRDIGYIPFEKDQLEAKAMDVLKELVGFGIVRFST
jgi:predicted nucleotide-binding protein